MNTGNIKQLMHIIFRRVRPRITIVLMVFWVVLTGELNLSSLLTGFFLSLFIVLFWGGFLLPPAPGAVLLIHPSLLIILGKMLLKFIVDLIKANIQVAKIVLNPRLPIKPGFIEYDLHLTQTTSRVLLANAITLTPGTLSVFLSREHIVVHALTREAASDVVEWELEKYLEKFEGA